MFDGTVCMLQETCPKFMGLVGSGSGCALFCVGAPFGWFNRKPAIAGSPNVDTNHSLFSVVLHPPRCWIPGHGDDASYALLEVADMLSYTDNFKEENKAICTNSSPISSPDKLGVD